MGLDVVVVGAGIGGAVLALELGRRGWRVAVVERETVPLRIPRPEVLWGATLDRLESLGVGEAIRRTASVTIKEIEIGDEKPWLQVTREDFTAAGVEALATDPSATRQIITDAAVATGNVEIQRGVAVEDLLYENGRVCGVQGKSGAVPVSFQARVVVGDDGGNSVVRTRLGIPITLEDFPVVFVTAAIPRWPLLPNRSRVWIRRGKSATGLSAAAFFPMPGSEGVLLIPVARERSKGFLQQTPAVFWGELERLTSVARALRENLDFPRDFRRIERPFGHAASYIADGAALIGDAAHPMTPAGGQGANASIWDALSLAEIADAALGSESVSADRLRPYERIRRPINEHSVSFSRLARRAFRVGGSLPLTIPYAVPLLARAINGLGWPKRRVLRSFANAFVTR